MLNEAPIPTHDIADERVTAAFDLWASLPKRNPKIRILSQIAYAQFG